MDKIMTVGDLRKLIENIDDDFKIDISIMEKVPEEILANSRYPYPWDMISGILEFQDVGYSDKKLCLGAYKTEEYE